MRRALHAARARGYLAISGPRLADISLHRVRVYSTGTPRARLCFTSVASRHRRTIAATALGAVVYASRVGGGGGGRGGVEIHGKVLDVQCIAPLYHLVNQRRRCCPRAWSGRALVERLVCSAGRQAQRAGVEVVVGRDRVERTRTCALASHCWRPARGANVMRRHPLALFLMGAPGCGSVSELRHWAVLRTKALDRFSGQDLGPFFGPRSWPVFRAKISARNLGSVFGATFRANFCGQLGKAMQKTGRALGPQGGPSSKPVKRAEMSVRNSV